MSSGENVFASPERWAEPTRDGGFVLTDPISGERMNPSVPPAWIEEDPYLHAGLSYLRTNADNIDLTVVYGAHSTVEDLGDPKKGWFEQQVAAADYYGFEGAMHRKNDLSEMALNTNQTLVQSLLRGREVFDFIAAARERNSIETDFQLRVSRAIAINASTKSFCYDVCQDGFPIERTLAEAYDVIKNGPNTKQHAVAYFCLLTARELVAIPKTGLKVLEGELGNPPRSIKVLETFGAAHRDYSRKVHTFTGVTPRTFKVRPESWERECETPRSISSTGVISPREVAALTELYASRSNPFYQS